MKIAVAYENGEIYGFFSSCPQFALYEYGEYVGDCIKTLVDTSDLEGNQAMADKMKELDVDVRLNRRAKYADVAVPEENVSALPFGIPPAPSSVPQWRYAPCSRTSTRTTTSGSFTSTRR